MKIPSHFDAYHKWLGIPPSEQPPTYYRLLGLEPNETDPDVIHAAADRQTAYLRTVQTGPHATQAAQLLGYIASARLCLTNSQQKANYDVVLKSAAPADADNEVVSRSQLVDADAPRAGAEFGAFEIVEPIRRSQFGDIFKARHRDSGRLVSLKLLSPSSVEREEVLRRFEREQKVTTSLSHPNLIAGFAAGVHNGQPYLVTEYVIGTDLATLVRQQGSLSVDEAVDYILQTARGLTQLHMHGVYHRNIKPHVLFVDMQGQIKITSLFLARLDEFASVTDGDDELTRMGQVMGTAEYMAPEQAADAKHADGRADTYALGCTFFYLLTGRSPFGGKSPMEKIAAHRTQPIPPLSSVRSDVPRRVDGIYRRMMEKDPSSRFQFMGDLVGALEPRVKPSLFQKAARWFSAVGESN